MRVPSPAEIPDRPSTVYLVKQLELAVRSQMEELLAPADVTVVQYTVLTVLQHRPEITGAELARRWHIRPQSTSGVIASLEAKGLVSRQPDPANRRRLAISITPRGQDLLREYDEKITWLEQQLLGDIPEASRQQFRRALIAARKRLDEAKWPIGHG